MGGSEVEAVVFEHHRVCVEDEKSYMVTKALLLRTGVTAIKGN
jgi:hypothetical protein